MKIRTIVLTTATVAVLGALLVLFFQVRSAQEIVVPEEALTRARAEYERGQSGRPSEVFQSDRSPAAARPPRRPASDLAAGEPAVEPPAGAAGANGASGDRPRALRRSFSSVRPPGSDPPPGSSAEQDRVRTAYDQGDFATALELAQGYLSQFPGDSYVQRVAVVSACAMGEDAVARKHYETMAATDRNIVARRCSRYGIQL